MSSQIASLTSVQPRLASTVFSIIDSRIQFLEYQINAQFDVENQQEGNHLLAYEKMMEFCAKTSRSMELLQILKEWVRHDNASIVLDLLQDDAYLLLTEFEIERKIKINDFRPMLRNAS